MGILQNQMMMNLFTSTQSLEIRKANRDFYDAIESLKIERMEDIWLNANEIQCIHPGWVERLVGWQAVMQSWYAIFQNTQYIEFNITDFNVTVDGQIASRHVHGKNDEFSFRRNFT